MSNFTDIQLSYETLDIYNIRKSILFSIEKNLVCFDGSMLDIGCGAMPYREYILSNSAVRNYVGLDIESALEYKKNVRPDFTWGGKRMPFEDNSFECAIGTEVLEHCPEPEIVLKETFRILKSGGIFFFTVPFLWNLHEVPHDQYRYTPFALERHLKNSGFCKIEIHAMGGWHASMAQMMGLWVKRAPMSNKLRRMLYVLVYPGYRYLLMLSRKENMSFLDGKMITGLYGIARKG